MANNCLSFRGSRSENPESGSIDDNRGIPDQVAMRPVRNDGVSKRRCMSLQPSGHLRIGDSELEYRMIGPQPSQAPTIVMLHEGLGSVALWGDFPDRLQAATRMGVFVYSRAGYGASTPVTLPRPLDYMSREALDVLPVLLDAIGFERGVF